jgi:hypothetical protein
MNYDKLAKAYLYNKEEIKEIIQNAVQQEILKKNIKSKYDLIYYVTEILGEFSEFDNNITGSFNFSYNDKEYIFDLYEDIKISDELNIIYTIKIKNMGI